MLVAHIGEGNLIASSDILLDRLAKGVARAQKEDRKKNIPKGLAMAIRRGIRRGCRMADRELYVFSQLRQNDSHWAGPLKKYIWMHIEECVKDI